MLHMSFVRRFFILLLVITFYSCSCRAETTKSPYSNGKFIEIDGYRVHYRTWVNEKQVDSDKPWLLLVHGFAGSTYSWEKNVTPLHNAGYNIVAVDVPPFGYSHKDRDFNHAVDSRAEFLWKFLNRINPKTKWHLFGHSMGGGIVAAMAILQPKKVKKVVFVAPALFNKVKPGRSMRQRLLAFSPVEWTMAKIGKLFLIRESRIERMLETIYGRPAYTDEVTAYYKPLKQKGMARAIISASTRANPMQTLSIADFKSEALAVWGANDTWVPFDGMKPFTDKMENLSIVIIKNTGHNPMETDANLFNRLVLDFLELD
ncbi:MAG: alpha/beta fold hydrolase [Bacteroidales bacterium]